MDDTSGPEKSGPERKTRRSHRKSRNGCSKCKERRIKVRLPHIKMRIRIRPRLKLRPNESLSNRPCPQCDELSPRCSRCAKMDLACLYPKRKTADYWLDGTTTPDSPSPALSLSVSPLSHSSILSSPLHSPVAQTLTPDEFALLKHYLEHTSRDPTVDESDQYTLQIGIPNLACESKPLMRSLLAFSAICQCRDLIDANPSVDRASVLAMSALADQYHLESLRETQTALNETTSYDAVLANAAIMGMYGSGSHLIRLWLARHGNGIDTVPKHPQWISLYRAVDLAYAALLNDTDVHVPTAPTYTVNVSPRTGMDPPVSSHPLSPIFAATMPSALAKLRARAEGVVSPDGTGTGTCRKALDLLEEVAEETFATSYHNASFTSTSTSTNRASRSGNPSTNPNARSGTSSPYAKSPQHDLHMEVNDISHPRLSTIAPWLRRYAAGITSAVPSRLPRRVVVRFAHRVEAGYLKLVEEGMVRLLSSYSPADVEGGGGLGEDTCMTGLDGSCIDGLDETHQLALDIFAHWLVLVMLLDEVWWIGEIGFWELGRIVEAARAAGLWREGDWWPESMWEVGRQVGKHRR